MVSPIDRLAGELAALKRQVRSLSRTPQLAYSSIEDGSVDEYDSAGNLAAVIGKQFDGSHGAYPVTGPVPPTPSRPVVEGGISLNVGWDGMFVGPDGLTDVTVPAPMDFTRVEVHASRVSGFVADSADTLIDTIESPRGGVRPALLAEGTWFVVLVARSASGKRSGQSAEASGVVRPPVTADEVQELQDALDGKTTTVTSTVEPSGVAAVGTVWQQEDAAHNIIGMWRFAGGSTPWQRVLFGDAMLGDVTATKVTAGIAGGGRVLVDETGLRGWDADNVQYLKAGASGLEMTGSISTVGETVEDVPRPISARLTTVARPLETRDWEVATPGLIFTTDSTNNPLNPSAVYSRDGKQLLLDVYDGPKHGRIILGPDDTFVDSGTFAVGYPSFLPHLHINTVEDYVVIGKSPWVGPSTTNVNLVGNVKVNGKTITPQPWTLIPMPAGRSALDGNKPAVRIDSTGEYYEFTGGIVMATGTSTAAGVAFLTLPTGFRPTVNKNFVVATSAGPLGMTIQPNGVMNLNPTGFSGFGWIDLSQLRFAINGPR